MKELRKIFLELYYNSHKIKLSNSEKKIQKIFEKQLTKLFKKKYEGGFFKNVRRVIREIRNPDQAGKRAIQLMKDDAEAQEAEKAQEAAIAEKNMKEENYEKLFHQNQKSIKDDAKEALNNPSLVARSISDINDGLVVYKSYLPRESPKSLSPKSLSPKSLSPKSSTGTPPQKHNFIKRFVDRINNSFSGLLNNIMNLNPNS